MVDIAPDTTGKYKEARTIRMKWKRVYEGYYIATCEHLGRTPVEYNYFCSIRKEHRPHYIRHRKVSELQ